MKDVMPGQVWDKWVPLRPPRSGAKKKQKMKKQESASESLGEFADCSKQQYHCTTFDTTLTLRYTTFHFL
jgi:hypothetical protein